MEHLDTGVLTQFGLMQKISTGNMVFDMALMFMMPVLLKYAVGYWAQLKEWIVLRCQKPTSKYVRHIEYTRHQGWYWYSDSDNNRNKVLQESILMFLDSKHDVVEKFKDASYKLTTTGSDEVDADDSDSDSDSDCGRSDEIRKYKVQIVPPEDIWFEVEPGIEFKKSQHETDNGDDKGKTVVTFIFQSELNDGQSKIDDFVDRALEMYKSRMAQKKDTARYFYTPQFSYSKSTNDEDTKSGMIYKRYKLSDEKTFDSFFHPEKQELTRLIDHFAKKQGKFAIHGYPHKLGILLHGPPGTGKTSLIKAVAQYTNRHIISIPLSRVRTNQELMDLVFNQACSVEGDSWNYKLPFKKTIFVMEDIDAACDVVKRRAGAAARYEKTAAGPENDPKKEAEKGEGEKDGDPPASSSSDKGESRAYTSAFLDKLMAESDDLNLAGVLNVLDGVVDCPNRIVVMTTNHPEKLDPALIRPGRINKQMYLGYLRLEEALQMAEVYFGELTEADKQKIANVFPDRVMSPAALESLCAECDVVDDLVRCIKDKHPGCVSRKTLAGSQGTVDSCDAVSDLGMSKTGNQSWVGEAGPTSPMVAPKKVPDAPLTPTIEQLELASAQVVMSR